MSFPGWKISLNLNADRPAAESPTSWTTQWAAVKIVLGPILTAVQPLSSQSAEV